MIEIDDDELMGKEEDMKDPAKNFDGFSYRKVTEAGGSYVHAHLINSGGTTPFIGSIVESRTRIESVFQPACNRISNLSDATALGPELSPNVHNRLSTDYQVDDEIREDIHLNKPFVYVLPTNSNHKSSLAGTDKNSLKVKSFQAII